MKSLLLIGMAGVCIVSAQDASGLKARELFYTPPPDAASPAPKVPAAPPAPKASPAPKPAASNATPSNATPKKEVSPKRTDPPAVANHAVAVAVPLGVRYSVLKRDAAGRFAEVDPDTTFRSGDRIRIQVKANTSGYLYVVAQGSSGTWQVLFPSADVEGGSNLLEPGDARQVPPGDRGQFVFDDRGGTEKLFLVLARQAEPDLDKLIYSMGGATPGSSQAARSLVARASVTNEVVERMRAQVSTRDLVFEKVDGEVDGKVEKAAYVVNPSASPDARLVIDMSLKHQ